MISKIDDKYDKRTFIIGMKPIGAAVSNGSAAGRVFSLKATAPDLYDAVQLVIYHSDPSATTTYSCIGAATETALNNSVANLTQPIVGGIQYNNLGAAESYGWKRYTFGGAVSITPPAGVTTSPTIILSDWLPLSAVPRADLSPLPLTLARLSIQGGTSNFGPGTNTGAGMEIPNSSNGGFILQSRWDSNLGLMVSDPAANNMLAVNNHMPTIGFNFRLKKRGISLMGVGDSLVQNNGIVNDVYSSIGLRAAAQISALGIPCGYINQGFSSANSLTYSAHAEIAINAWKPNALFVASNTPNDGNFSTDAFMRNAIQNNNARYRGLIQTALQYNAIPFIGTFMPCSATTIPLSSQDNLRNNNNNLINKKLDRIAVLEWDKIVTDNGSPARMLPEFQFDSIHQNEAAIILQAEQLVRQLRIAYKI